MKVFVSHQRADSELAAAVAGRLRLHHSIECYLDLIDPDSGSKGDDLGEHIRDELGKCTQLMAVVSSNTKGSWWVPWEIGVATEKDQPIATYAGDNSALPEYLKKWPYLRSNHDLDIYAQTAKAAEQNFRIQKGYATDSVARGRSTREFYREIRSRLGQ